MTVRLTVRTAIWRSQIARTVAATPGLVPVIKGNGYGFGRLRLAELAAEFCHTVAVGTIHELEGLPDSLTAVVLISSPRIAGGLRLKISDSRDIFPLYF